MSYSNKLIKEFRIDNSKKAFVHPLFPNKHEKSEEALNIYLLTLGHLWLYKIVEENGNNIYLNEIIKYAEKRELTLFEWELTEENKKDILDILSKYHIPFIMYLDESFELSKHDKIVRQSKDKEHLYHTLTRVLLLAKYHYLFQLISENELKKIVNWEDKQAVINATFLGVWMIKRQNGIEITPIPDFLVKIVEKNMSCYTESARLRYYPQIDYILNNISDVESELSENWYLIPDDSQVLLSKFLYSLRLIKEISINPIGLNGILSTFVTRTLFDNLWQSKYLITENKINEYRVFALDRMRLHVVKRSDMPEVNNIDELLTEIEGGVFDPIPINGDYFTKSAREYAIQLGLKDEYDKYYEYNSEFIHASLTAVYSGIMCRCSNPEHNMHLTINPRGSNYIDCAKHIFEIVNMHIDILNAYFDYEICAKFNLQQIFFNKYSDYKEFVRKVQSSNTPE
ncbi:hypothetical protein [Aminipila terrae]|uniref:Uncharacterized protein n=1 Tax=Aminipila terrae TaxID=2697030 RepID=A0A6P1MHV7_9FIRM|nr:hypothetical protein [Aminipila terrae]QHI73477.1 hypothetical protein Ami3637_14805 [Aminipila terrae]